jgi:hypothetical protein
MFRLFDCQLHKLNILRLSYLKDVEMSNTFCDLTLPDSLMLCVDFSSNKMKYIGGPIFSFYSKSRIHSSSDQIVHFILRIPSLYNI